MSRSVLKTGRVMVWIILPYSFVHISNIVGVYIKIRHMIGIWIKSVSEIITKMLKFTSEIKISYIDECCEQVIFLLRVRDSGFSTSHILRIISPELLLNAASCLILYLWTYSGNQYVCYQREATNKRIAKIYKFIHSSYLVVISIFLHEWSNVNTLHLCQW